jgi:GMP synthase-like glutamine amidotransferase
MKIHFVLHETFEGPGCINDWIKLKGYQVSISRTFLQETYPAMDQFDWLIIMGGTMSTYEEEEHKWLRAEKRFIRKSVESGKTVLGICFGAQLIAEVLGAKVYQAEEKEIGWFPVKLMQKNMPEELRPLPESTFVFHWHGDTFDLPEGAIHLASSVTTINQAFLYKGKVMALQYHHEVTREALAVMLDNLGWQLKKERYVQSAEEIIKGARHISENNRLMFKIMDYLDCHK